jgi:hypothetical protein
MWTFEELIEAAAEKGMDFEIISEYNDMLEDGYSSDQAATETARLWHFNGDN